MTIISSAEITEEIRRTNVRELAGISTATFTDDQLDAKIENADEVAKTYLSVQEKTLDGTEDYFRNLVTIANLICSVFIRQGIAGQENAAIAKEQIAMYESIVAAQNQRKPEQGQLHATRTSGINSKSGDFG